MPARQHPETLYVIEARDAAGALDLADPQPEEFFGLRAITGIGLDDIAKVVFQKKPNAVLTGDSIALWPSHLDSRFRARQKTW